MTDPTSHTIPEAPGGMLILRSDGTIVSAPFFFRRALFLEQRRVPSIFHLCDPGDPPFLSLKRIFRHPYGGMEYHLQVDGFLGTRYGFRYWAVDLEGLAPDENAFFIVDDSALLQTQDWDLRRLRRALLADVQESLSSHFKNRLAAVQLLAETLRDAPELARESAPRLLQAVDELHKSINRVVTGVESVGASSDYEDAPLRLSDLATVINAWGKRHVSIRCIMKDVATSTLIPSSSIERILFPVVENALDASQPGTSVEVTVSESDDGYAVFEVIDFGEGMNERVRQRFQDPFFTTRTGHLGTGLSHAQQALRQADGQWHFESVPRKGTRVTLRLPVTTAEQLFQ